MITKQDLEQAIAECQGERNPNANTCLKLASYLTIKNELFGKSEQLERADYAHSYSHAAPPEPVENTISNDSDTEFSRAINGRSPSDILHLMDELMTTLQVLQPRIYDSVMRRLQA